MPTRSVALAIPTGCRVDHGLGDRGSWRLEFVQVLAIKVGGATGDRIDESDAYILLQQALTLVDESLPVLGPILVRRVNQFDGGHQTEFVLCVDVDFVFG